jgi:hypothetical protein
MEHLTIANNKDVRFFWVTVLFLNLLFINSVGIAQDLQLYLKGKVLHLESKEPVPFAHIFFKKHENQGVTSDVRGDFRLPTFESADTVVISHVGFEKMVLSVSALKNNTTIFLQPKQIEIAEYTFFAGENPALAIVQKAISNKPANDPDNLRTYQYNAYSKFVFTLEGLESQDSINSRIDSLLEGGHLFISESFSEIRYKKPGKKNEIVKASKMSGIKSPIIGLVSSTFQPFSLYTDHINILEIPYLNPMSKDGMKKYDYFLEDSIQTDLGTSYIISFQPQKGKTYLVGRGIMTVSSQKYALENIVFRSIENGSNLQFELQQKNNWNGQNWFPEQINSQYILKETDIEGRNLKLINQNFISNVAIDSDADFKEINPVALVFDIQNELYPLDVYRQDTLSQKEMITYERFDSLDDKKLNFLNFLSRLITKVSIGRIPLGPVDLLTNRFLRINQHEGPALGLGLSTNGSLSDYLRLEGYFRYGFRDMAWKYGAGVETIISKVNDSKLSLYYSQDVSEIGHIPFISTPTFSRASDIYRDLLAERMDQVERIQLEFSQIPRRNWRVGITGSLENRKALWTQELDQPIAIENAFLEFRSAEVGMNLRYIFRENASKIENSFLPGLASYPVFQMQLVRAIPEILASNADYWRASFKMQQQWKKGLSLNRLQISGMYAWGDVLPVGMMNTGFGIRPQSRNLSVVFPGYLQTMRIYEFLSDRVMYVSYSHMTGPLFNKRRDFVTFAPQVNLTQSLAIGSLNDSFIATAFDYQTLEQGYYETGLELRNLLKYKSGIGFQGIGIGAFYRWGPYANATPKDNLVINFSLSTAF